MRKSLLAISLLSVCLSACARCVVKKDERADLYPGYASFDPSKNAWTVVTHGRIYKPAHGKVFRMSLAVLHLADLASKSAPPPGFDRSAESLFAHDVKKRKVKVRLADSKKALPADKTDALGQFRKELEVPASQLGKPDSDGFVRYSVPSCQEPAPEGKILLVEPEGLSVVSDVDDTIRASDSSNPASLLVRALLKPGRPVEGMSSLYQTWKSEGARFHYVSTLPWELYEPLDNFLTRSGFPEGTVQLKSWGLSGEGLMEKLEQLPEVLSERASETQAIEELLQQFPRRHFVLVGNTASADPEVYADLASRYPEQVRHVFLRETEAGSKADAARKAMEGVSRDKWTVFSNPDEIKEVKP